MSDFRMTMSDQVILLMSAPLFALFAVCFGLLVHDALAADYLPALGGKFGWTSFWLYLLIGTTAVLGIIFSVGAILIAMEYRHDDPDSVVAVFVGAILLPFATLAIIGLPMEPGVIDFLILILGLGLPLAGLAMVMAEMKYAHTRPYGL